MPDVDSGQIEAKFLALDERLHGQGCRNSVQSASQVRIQLVHVTDIPLLVGIEVDNTGAVVGLVHCVLKDPRGAPIFG